ncbi:aminotransferase class V-fold PLP-dependent enzyme [Spiroplasma culicicola]|uniref:cysteine desulfurase n=1 Tax=Spiroplasma culicicola AES-1 TaxID=1276246 RepID=W6A7N1_9MOLU|nr:cysteine desulfurase [Spiroplasma culicicola]AHI53148.1 cysteine desulfurase [Spiroplasma culicicola AES-1]
MSYKENFPYFKYNKEEIYLDTAATSLKPKSVLDAEYEYNVKIAANTHNTLFNNAYKANQILEETRKLTGFFIGVENKEEIIFTSGATHSINQIVFGMQKTLSQGDEIVLNELEHSSNLLPWMVLAEKLGLAIKYFKLKDEGTIDINHIKDVINEKTKFVSFASVSNTYGGWNDVKTIVKNIRQINKNVKVVVDSAQSIAHIKTDVIDWDIDFLAFSAHKMYGPFGLGILWAKKDWLEIMDPIFYGGGNNSKILKNEYSLAKIPYKFEAGTLNLSAIAGFKEALNFINKISIEKINTYESMLKKYFVKLTKTLDPNKIKFYNLESNQPIVLFNVNKVNAQDFGIFLNKKYNISVRVGKHCARLAKDFSAVDSTIRASFGIYTTKKDLKYFIEALNDSDAWIDELI